MQVKGGLMVFPVEFGSDAAGKAVRDIRWPNGALVVGLRRGEKELVPQGGTKIAPGDYLVILSSGEQEGMIRDQVRTLCRAETE